MKRSVLAPAALLCLAAAPLSFESVSIKRVDSSTRLHKFEERRFIAASQSLQSLIAIAYDLPPMGASRLYGGPGWVRTEHFDVEGDVELPARTEPRDRATKMKLMLRTMLADRFKLALRTETRNLPIYTLTVAKGGPKLKPATLDEKDCAVAPIGVCHTVNGGPGVGLRGKAATMEDLARAASTFSERPIVDNTGIEGLFEIDTSSWVDTRPFPGTGGWDSPWAVPGPTIIAIFQRLGLNMREVRAPVEVFVIDHAEHPATN